MLVWKTTRYGAFLLDFNWISTGFLSKKLILPVAEKDFQEIVESPNNFIAIIKVLRKEKQL